MGVIRRPVLPADRGGPCKQAALPYLHVVLFRLKSGLLEEQFGKLETFRVRQGLGFRE